MDSKNLLEQINGFKLMLKEYRNLTELYVENWKRDTPLQDKMNASEEDELRYQYLKSEITQKSFLFGEELQKNLLVIFYSNEKKVREKNGLGHIFTIANNLVDERLTINNFNRHEGNEHKKIWSIILHGIEKYIGEVKYVDGKEKNIKKKEIEFTKREKDLKKRETQVDALSKALEKFMKIVTDPKKGAIEAVRSEYVSKIKENHRKIEKNTNPNTKSQFKKIAGIPK
jgi:hypothetical protein